MKERPILFSAPMVHAILAGTKTMTRRVLKDKHAVALLDKWEADFGPPATVVGAGGYGGAVFVDKATGGTLSQPIHCPYGAPGDRLWVRETWQPIWAEHRERRPSIDSPEGWNVNYAADGVIEYHDDEHGLTTRCKPGIHMPRWASRITLEVTAVRVERLQAITEDDARAEGVERDTEPCDHTRLSCDEIGCMGPTYRSTFAELWWEINGQESWDANPWVWCVTFKRNEAQERAA